jgi:cell division protein FtsL
MPRGIKGNIDERIADLKVKLEKKQSEFNEIKSQIKTLEDQKRNEQIEKVIQMAEKQGLSIDEFLETVIK